jgi:hypothetical protein
MHHSPGFQMQVSGRTTVQYMLDSNGACAVGIQLDETLLPTSTYQTPAVPVQLESEAASPSWHPILRSAPMQ